MKKWIKKIRLLRAILFMCILQLTIVYFAFNKIISSNKKMLLTLLDSFENNYNFLFAISMILMLSVLFFIVTYDIVVLIFLNKIFFNKKVKLRIIALISVISNTMALIAGTIYNFANNFKIQEVNHFFSPSTLIKIITIYILGVYIYETWNIKFKAVLICFIYFLLLVVGGLFFPKLV